MCAEPIGEQHQHVVDLDSRGADVHLPACYLLFTAEGAAAALPRRARPLPVLPGLRARRPASGTSWRSRSGWRSSSATRCWAGRSPSTRARPGPPSPSCRSAPGTRSSPPTRARHCSRPTSRRCWSGRPDRAGEPAEAATSSRSTRCYELVGALRLVWRGFDGGQEARAALDAFFADLAARSRPAPTGAAALMPELSFTVVDVVARAVRRRAAPARPAADRGDHRRAGPRHRAARARSGSSRSAAATTTPRSGRCSTCSATATRWAEHAQAVPVAAAPRPWSRASPARPRSTCRCRAPTTSRSSGTTYLHALRDGEIPLLFLFSGTVFTRGATGFAVDPGAVGPRGALPAAGRGLARPDGAATSRAPAGCGCAATPSTRSRTTGTSAASPPGTTPSTRCSAEAVDGRWSRRDPRPGPRSSPTPSSTRGTCSTPTGRPRRRTRCAGSSGCSGPPGAAAAGLGEEAGPGRRVPAAAGRTGRARSPCTCASCSCSGGRSSGPTATAASPPVGGAARRGRRLDRPGTRPSRSSASWARFPLAELRRRACTWWCRSTAARTSSTVTGRAAGPPAVAAARAR